MSVDLVDLSLDVFQKNKRLIGCVARRYSGIDPSLDYEDLLSEAFLAIMDALVNFESEKKTEFTSYLFWHLQKKFQIVLGNDKVVEVEVDGEKNIISHSEFLRMKASLPKRTKFRIMTIVSSLEEIIENGEKDLLGVEE